MKHIFKASSTGGYKTASGESYDCKCVRTEEKLPKGWCNTLEQALKASKKAAPKEVEVKADQAPQQQVI